MRLTGTLRTWHDDQGFGFIAPTQGGREVFVHVSAFPRDGARPLPGEKLGYDLAPGRDGKPQALRVQRLAWAGATALAPSSRRPPSGPRPRSFLRSGLVAAAVLIVGVLAYRHFQAATAPMPMAQTAPPVATPVDKLQPLPVPPPEPAATMPIAPPRPSPPAAQPAYRPTDAPAPRAAVTPQPAGRCDGRTHCSQMTSCAEATFFLQHCPGVKMDGDADGIPCEEQWCNGPQRR